MNKRVIALFLSVALLTPVLQGCFAFVATGVAVGVMSAVDRRSLGTQTDDESIEWKALTRAANTVGDKVHLNFTSFNRKVLISGEVPSAEARSEVERIVLSIPNVQGVYNEVRIAPPSSLGERSNDTYLTTRIKGRSIDLKGKYSPVQVKVVTEAGVSYLMGIVTQTEADSAIQITATTPGVKKVKDLFEVISPEKAKELEALRASEEQKAANQNNANRIGN